MRGRELGGGVGRRRGGGDGGGGVGEGEPPVGGRSSLRSEHTATPAGAGAPTTHGHKLTCSQKDNRSFAGVDQEK